MKQARSLHLGLNYVDPDHYDGWDGELFACEADARDMTALAAARGFTPQTLLREQVTARAVKAAILDAAKTLASGDTFFLTYSGHGGQVPDRNADEGRFGDSLDRMDETWCLWDRELVDDELAALYARFRAGVRVLVLSDSCHSGSVTRVVAPAADAADADAPAPRVRALPRERAAAVYERHRALYDAIQRGVTGAEQQAIRATVLLISGCQDQQLSRDGDFNGAFTGNLKRVWDDGRFRGNYRRFRDRIAARMLPDQTPNYFVIGAPNPAFENELPFTGGAKVPKTKPPEPPAAGSAPAPETPLAFVLRELGQMGMPQPTATADVRTFFAELEARDGDFGLDFTRTDDFRQRFRQTFKGAALKKSDLLRGRYPTAQALADLAPAPTP